MGATSTYSWPYPDLVDAPNGPSQFQALADAIETDVARIDAVTSAWTNYSGSLSWTASTTNPTIGNGTITARYVHVGKLVIYSGDITMGSTTTFGSGTYFVSVPVAALSIMPYTGSCLVYDSSVGTNRQPAVATLSTTSKLAFYATTGLVTSTVPFTWASGDVLRWLIAYETA